MEEEGGGGGEGVLKYVLNKKFLKILHMVDISDLFLPYSQGFKLFPGP